jgi:hypothetical protein
MNMTLKKSALLICVGLSTLTLSACYPVVDNEPAQRPIVHRDYYQGSEASYGPPPQRTNTSYGPPPSSGAQYGPPDNGSSASYGPPDNGSHASYGPPQ